MLQSKTSTQPQIRFRRWSRKSYAIFSSLGRCVTIGSVCSSISDLSLRKSSTLCGRKTVNTLSETEIERFEDETEFEEITLILNKQAEVANWSVMKIAEASCLLLYNNFQ